MSSINHYIANATGELTKLIPLIDEALSVAIPIVESELSASQIDIIFVSAAAIAIPEYGIGGNSHGPNHIYVSFDPESNKITEQGLVETLLHETHHCMRWRDPGYGETFGEAMVTEGMACLYEEEHGDKPPIYATVELPDKQVELAKNELGSANYNHAEWFFGSGKITRWFGYTYGYQLCKQYANAKGLTGAQLVRVPASEILNYK
jgi:uncharacterized protein YjaZ